MRDDISEEVEALWMEVFGEPPVMRGDPSFLLTLIIQSLSRVEYVEFAEAADARPQALRR